MDSCSCLIYLFIIIIILNWVSKFPNIKPRSCCCQVNIFLGPQKVQTLKTKLGVKRTWKYQPRSCRSKKKKHVSYASEAQINKTQNHETLKFGKISLSKEPNNNMVEQKGITSKGVHPTKNLVVSNNNNNLDREAISNPNLRRDLTHHHRT